MGDEPHQIRANRAVWNEKADKYAHPDSGLPNWGPFHVGRQDATLIGAMEGKRFLEIGFGAGYSIAYLIEHGAEHVTGIDFSDRQRELATERNRLAIDAGKVRLVKSSMEQRTSLEAPVDTVFSIFALGWSIDLAATLANAASYLKPGEGWCSVGSILCFRSRSSRKARCGFARRTLRRASTRRRAGSRDGPHSSTRGRWLAGSRSCTRRALSSNGIWSRLRNISRSGRWMSRTGSIIFVGGH